MSPRSCRWSANRELSESYSGWDLGLTSPVNLREQTMVVFRLNQCLMRLMKLKLYPIEAISTNRLGDWHCSDVYLSNQNFIVGISSKARLLVLAKQEPLANLPPRFRNQLSVILRSLGIDSGQIREELASMLQFEFSNLNDKELLDALGEAKCELIQLDLLGELDLENLVAIALKLSRIRSRGLRAGCPSEAAREYFGIASRVKQTVTQIHGAPILYVVR